MTSGRAFSTFGPRYSNISASLLLTNTSIASEINIWTQTATFYTAPPTQIPSARSIPSLTYAEAHEMLHSTPHLMHPLTLKRAQKTDARVCLRNIHDPLATGTIIESSHVKRQKAATISTVHPTNIMIRQNVTLLSVASDQSSDPTSFFKDVFGLLARYNLPTTITTTSIVNVMVALPASSNLTFAIAELESLHLKTLTVEPDYAIISIVGEYMWCVHLFPR